MQTSELNIKDLGQSLLGVIVPHDFGSMWVGPGRGARVAGILLPIDRKADDIRFLDGYFQNRLAPDEGLYDIAVVTQFLAANPELPFQPILGACRWPLHSGWIPVISRVDPGHPIFGMFYGQQIILVYPPSL